MSLIVYLKKHKAAITRKWFELLANSYAPDTANFLKTQKDPFENPVGINSLESLRALFDVLLEKGDAEQYKTILDPIVRVRALQGFSPSQALAFIPSLKALIWDEIKKAGKADLQFSEFLEFAARIDSVAMAAFDLYMQCREKIYELMANEHRNRFFSAFERAGLVKEMPEKAISDEVV